MAAISVNGACSSKRSVPPDAIGDTRTYLDDASRAPSADQLAPADPDVEWEADLGRGTLGALALGPAAGALTTVDRWLYAFDPRSGRPFWRTRGETPFAAGPLVQGDRVYVASEGRDGSVAAYELRKGKRRWRRRVGDVAAPMVVGDSLLFGTTHGTGYTFALRKDDGEVAWRARTGGSISGPLVMGSHVVVVTLTDSLFVMQAASGDIVTRAALGASTAAPLAQADDSTAVLTTPSGSVIAVTIPSGRVAWRHDAARPIFGSPVALRDTIFALTNGCTLWMIPRAAPDAAAPRALGCNSVATPLLTRDGVLVATVGGDIVLFDRSTGERRWERHIGGELRQAPALVDGRIIAAPVLGPVVSLR